ncbi:hypothetical protein PTTG_09668, partial [Puccinia triticina 1-1 BBBD Race 1]
MRGDDGTGFPVVSTRLGFPRHSDGENDEDSTAAPGIPVKNCPPTSSPSSSPPPTPSSSLCYLQALLTAQPPKTKAAQSKIAISPSLTDRTTGLGSFSSQPTGNASDHDYRISDSAAGLRTQYLITNLAPATNYSAWLFQPRPGGQQRAHRETVAVHLLPDQVQSVSVPSCAQNIHTHLIFRTQLRTAA